MPQLDPTWFASQLFWLLVTFVVLYVVMSKLVLPPLLDVMSLRKDTMESDLGAAQTMKTQAEDAKAQYEKALTEARARSLAVMDEAMKAHKAQAEAATRAMDAQVSAKLREAETRIRAKKDELKANLGPVATELSQSIASKLTNSHDNDKPNKVRSLAKGNG
ncbi:MAG: F0F1 ATP synthase subunit B' [Alphaproteobacteria bacterium]